MFCLESSAGKSSPAVQLRQVPMTTVVLTGPHRLRPVRHPTARPCPPWPACWSAARPSQRL